MTAGVEIDGVEVDTGILVKWMLPQQSNFLRTVDLVENEGILFLGAEETHSGGMPEGVCEKLSMPCLNAGVPGYGMWQINNNWDKNFRDTVSPIAVIVEVPFVGRMVWDPTMMHHYNVDTRLEWEHPPSDVAYRKIGDLYALAIKELVQFYFYQRSTPIWFWKSGEVDVRDHSLKGIPEHTVLDPSIDGILKVLEDSSIVKV